MKTINLNIQYHQPQTDIFFNDTAQIKMVAKGRRFGLTRGYANYVIESLIDKVSPILWVDTINGNIDRYVERYFLPVLKNIDSSLWKWRQTKKELNLMGSVCDFRSADNPENIEGFGYALIILNEAGIILKDEYLWHNTIQPMILDYKAKVIAGGTPKGKGLFHRLCLKAKEKEGWSYFHYSTYDNPFLNKSDIDALCEDMPTLVKKQEIFAEFLSEQSAVFGNFENCIKGHLQEPVIGEHYVAGLDIARLQDYTVLIILNSQNHVCFFGRIQHHSWDYQKQWVSENLKRYNDASILMDSTGIGDVFFESLQGAGARVSPYKFTAESKKKLIENLMLSIEQERISFPEIDVLIDELSIFEYTLTANGIKYGAPSGSHDDTVIALALARMQSKGVCNFGITSAVSPITGGIYDDWNYE